MFSLENLYRAYRQCRKRKRNTMNALIFEADLEANLLDLQDDLTQGRYAPRPSIAFLVKKPKRREIFAADFRDRVVHHVLVNDIEPFWERRFIHDSYACRKGKGTHGAVDRLRSFMRQVTCNGTRRAWYLQLDVRGFFVAIDRTILFERLTGRRPDESGDCIPLRGSAGGDPAIFRLLQTILCNEPAANCRLRGASRADFEALPAHKTLFKAAPGRGLPIGNLTSQFFANVYLDALDQFVKHELRVRYYIRYCDDVVLLAPERERLAGWERAISDFLREKLRLELNARRKLRPVDDGVDFLGYIVRANYLLVRRRVVGAMRQRLFYAERELIAAGMTDQEGVRMIYPWPWPLLEKIRRWLNAYLGHLAKADARKLKLSLTARFGWLHEYFTIKEDKVVFKCPTPRSALRFRCQLQRFKTFLPGHVLLFQVGTFWEAVFAAGVLEKTREGPGKRLVDCLDRWAIPLRRNMAVGLRETSPLGPKTERGVNRIPRQKDLQRPARQRLGSWRIAGRRLEELKPLLWASGLPVAWIEETGRRLVGIGERALTKRWEGLVPVDSCGGGSCSTASRKVGAPDSCWSPPLDSKGEAGKMPAVRGFFAERLDSVFIKMYG